MKLNNLSSLERIRLVLSNKDLKIKFIQDILGLKIKKIKTLPPSDNKWDYNHIKEHYFACSKCMVTLDNDKQIIVRIAYFRQDNLLNDWDEAIIAEGAHLLLESQTLSEQELKDNPLIPTQAIAITHVPKENMTKTMRMIKDEQGNCIQCSAFHEKIAAKIFYLDLSKARRL